MNDCSITGCMFASVAEASATEFLKELTSLSRKKFEPPPETSDVSARVLKSMSHSSASRPLCSLSQFNIRAVDEAETFLIRVPLNEMHETPPEYHPSHCPVLFAYGFNLLADLLQNDLFCIQIGNSNI